MGRKERKERKGERGIIIIMVVLMSVCYNDSHGQRSYHDDGEACIHSLFYTYFDMRLL